MTIHEETQPPIEEPLAELERQLMHAYLAASGHDLHALLMRDDDEARQLLAGASRHASEKLTEVESRSHYLRTLRGGP